MNIVSDIMPLTDFRRHAKEVSQQLRDTGRPTVLTVNGKASLVVLDARAWQQIQDRMDKMEELLGLKRSLNQALAGEVADARIFFDAIEGTK